MPQADKQPNNLEGLLAYRVLRPGPLNLLVRGATVSVEIVKPGVVRRPCCAPPHGNLAEADQAAPVRRN